jgi:hypothetical protein
MPIYKFRDVVEAIAKEKEISLFGTHDNLLRQIKKDIEDKKITPDEVPDKMKDHKDFRLNFSRDDFEKIVRAIK